MKIGHQENAIIHLEFRPYLYISRCLTKKYSFIVMEEVLNYRILLREGPEGGFTIFVPSLEGCITYGETLEEAKRNAKEAIKLYIESLENDNLPIPSDENFL